MMASSNGKFDVMKDLLSHGANVNLLNTVRVFLRLFLESNQRIFHTHSPMQAQQVSGVRYISFVG